MRLLIGLLYYERSRNTYWFMCSTHLCGTKTWVDTHPGGNYLAWDVYEDQIYPFSIPCHNCLDRAPNRLFKRGMCIGAAPEQLANGEGEVKEL